MRCNQPSGPKRGGLGCNPDRSTCPTVISLIIRIVGATLFCSFAPYLTSNMPQAHYASQGEFMGARQSAETTSAIRLVLEGRKTVYQAAEMCGIYASTLYRALNRKPKKRVDKKKA